MEYRAPIINPLPIQADGMKEPVLSLNGSEWELQGRPANVPSYVMNTEGEYTFKRWLNIPEEWRGQQIFIRFEGVNCLARVLIDDTFVKEHYGGFLSWDCEITDFVKASGTHRLSVQITDKPRELAPFQQGGIVRDVLLYVVPHSHIFRLHAGTTFTDESYTDAMLKVEAGITGVYDKLELSLTDPEKREFVIGTMAGSAESTDCYRIKVPMKWDSEHPNLYVLTARLYQEGKCLEQVQKKIGFRQIKKVGTKVFINGREIKLRGINHHDVHPVTGRCITKELAETDVRLFKEANINFIRTSHYPPRTDFLDLCDEYGIYVEDEAGLAFAGYETDLTQDDPEYREKYLNHFAEMIERDKTHPCIIIWSLANESRWGINHSQCLNWARQEDPDRLTIFSYPITQTEEDDCPDLWSAHYINWDAPLNEMTEAFRRSMYLGEKRPVLHDESTHIPCYDQASLTKDPGLRDFWGETIGPFWERIWHTEGALGCAIWAGIDDVILGDGQRRVYPWGIVDGWRRKKPEYWHVRKAYSPIVLPSKPKQDRAGIQLRLYNRFNHTDLSEVRVKWEAGNAFGEVNGPNAAPGEEGVLIIPAAYDPGERLRLTFFDARGFVVDERELILEERRQVLPKLCGRLPSIDESPTEYRFAGKDWSLCLSRETGLITAGYIGEELVLTGGPYLHLNGLDLEPWKLGKMAIKEAAAGLMIELEGSYGLVEVSFSICIDAEGTMEVSWTIKQMPYTSPRQIAITSSVITHRGGYHEVGIFFTAAAELNVLQWQKRGLWDVYPDWHIGRLKGRALKHNTESFEDLRQLPQCQWKDEEYNELLLPYDVGRRGTRDFYSMKSSVEKAVLMNDKGGLMLISDGRDSVRMEILPAEEQLVTDGDPRLVYYGSWQQMENRSHSFGGTETVSNKAGDWCELKFRGNGIVWYSSSDRICGTADIYIDGQCEAAGIDLGCSRSGKDPRGYRKHWRYPVFAKENMKAGDHEIKIVVTGIPAAESYNAYVSIDAFWILDDGKEGDTRFIIDREFNYPELSWADYVKPPILIKTGYSGKHYLRISKNFSDVF